MRNKALSVDFLRQKREIFARQREQKGLLVVAQSAKGAFLRVNQRLHDAFAKGAL